MTIDVILLFLREYAEFNLLIVDNEGNNELKSYCDKSKIRYVYERKLGLSFARNVGLELTVDDWVYFLDDDVYITLELLNDLKLCINKLEIVYSCVVPSTWPVVEGHEIGRILWGSMSVHGNKEVPIGCSFGFYNSGRYKFDERKGRVGRNFSGDEENELIHRMKNDGYRLRLLNGIVVHRIGNKLNLKYIQDYYRNEFLNSGRFVKIRMLAYILFSFFYRKSYIYRKALLNIYKDL